MKYFIDTEFIEDGRTIELLSIAIVGEDGRELYAEVDPSDVDHDKADEWVKTNVIANLWHKQPDLPKHNQFIRDGGIGGLLYRKDLVPTVRRFCGDNPEFWAYYADYDWVVFCQLFGRMLDLPKGWPLYCRDLKQLMVDRGLDLKQSDSIHNALEDARWVATTYKQITEAR